MKYDLKQSDWKIWSFYNKNDLFQFYSKCTSYCQKQSSMQARVLNEIKTLEENEYLSKAFVSDCNYLSFHVPRRSHVARYKNFAVTRLIKGSDYASTPAGQANFPSKSFQSCVSAGREMSPSSVYRVFIERPARVKLQWNPRWEAVGARTFQVGRFLRSRLCVKRRSYAGKLPLKWPPGRGGRVPGLACNQNF